VLLRAWIGCGELVALGEREGGGGGRGRGQDEDASLEAQRRLVREIEALVRRGLGHAGRQYRLVPDGDLARLRDRDSYEVVRQDDAARVLDGVAGQGALGGGRLALLLAEAKSRLARDWRPPLEPEGLVLLRKLIAPQAYEQEVSPAITPSQMKEMLKGWVELVVVWDDTGQPIAGVPLTVESEGASQTLKTDGDGRVRAEDLDGTCEVSCSIEGVTLDECVAVVGVGSEPVTAEGKAAAKNGAAPKAIAAIEAHRVATGETIETIAAKAGVDAKQLAKFNWGTDAPEEVNERLYDEVGCTKKTADGRNYLLDDTDSPGIIYIPNEWRQRFALKQTHYVRVRRPKGILIRLENEEGLRLPEVGYHVGFDDGTERTGRLGRNGMALVSSPSTGTFQVTYPDEEDILAKSLAASLRKGFDDRTTGQIFRLFTHDRPVVTRAVAAYDQYFNDYTGRGLIEDLYQELTDPEALALCEALMALHGLPTQSGVRAAGPPEEE
jgi:LysM repeat protein/bifunctional DNA-binding transcriptional regulator/antitoxin component of YhaV-PrlF toxin-antitoxin module